MAIPHDALVFYEGEWRGLAYSQNMHSSKSGCHGLGSRFGKFGAFGFHIDIWLSSCGNPLRMFRTFHLVVLLLLSLLNRRDFLFADHAAKVVRATGVG